MSGWRHLHTGGRARLKWTSGRRESECHDSARTEGQTKAQRRTINKKRSIREVVHLGPFDEEGDD